jgi:hypothetical protein
MTAELEGVRVLVVEDEFLVATLIEDMLEALEAAGRGTYDAAIVAPSHRVPSIGYGAIQRAALAASFLPSELHKTRKMLLIGRQYRIQTQEVPHAEGARRARLEAGTAAMQPISLQPPLPM